MKVSLYARVSTAEQQSLPAQIKTMTDYAEKRGWEIVSVVQEVGSGAKNRPERQKMMDSARRRELDGIVVWKLDRWGRSVQDLVSTLNELLALNVTFTSITEALDFSTPSGRAMAGMLGVFAQFEHDLIRERVRSGLADARLKGKILGRPETTKKHKVKVLALQRKGLSNSAIALKLGIDRRSVGRLIAASPAH